MSNERKATWGDGVALGLLIGVVLSIILWAILSSTFIPQPKNHEILWRTETGVTCHVDSLYPKADCEALLDALGPRLSQVKQDK